MLWQVRRFLPRLKARPPNGCAFGVPEKRPYFTVPAGSATLRKVCRGGKVEVGT